jgi:hypothetical protein
VRGCMYGVGGESESRVDVPLSRISSSFSYLSPDRSTRLATRSTLCYRTYIERALLDQRSALVADRSAHSCVTWDPPGSAALGRADREHPDASRAPLVCRASPSAAPVSRIEQCGCRVTQSTRTCLLRSPSALQTFTPTPESKKDPRQQTDRDSRSHSANTTPRLPHSAPHSPPWQPLPGPSGTIAGLPLPARCLAVQSPNATGSKAHKTAGEKKKGATESEWMMQERGSLLCGGVWRGWGGVFEHGDASLLLKK